MSQSEYSGSTKAKQLWGTIQRPEYARDEDGIDAIMTRECSIYAANGEVCVDEANLAKNFKGAKVNSRDVSRQKSRTATYRKRKPRWLGIRRPTELMRMQEGNIVGKMASLGRKYRDPNIIREIPKK